MYSLMTSEVPGTLQAHERAQNSELRSLRSWLMHIRTALGALAAEKVSFANPFPMARADHSSCRK